ncbi:hypothetical protein F9L16_17680 [Agarivorans sp. B2Z047]|uniref:Ig-like domain-containing protein n=1 Tax=Agarivorans sp. B2Z047 TaxID=2652721 RepID=UPI00128D19DE|nr:Ig-like domain-containing protein [Agarivorans sp. B2Z047]MPW30820.1 hypothetical protein [Agarivorans sp. B2Z047]UQN40949.1 Ig-like domain-containing protein [Agarivorans sp. B2Z047]
MMSVLLVRVFLLLVTSLMLFGCVEDVDTSPVEVTPIAAQSGLVNIVGGEDSLIDLSPWVQHGGGAKLIGVTPVNQSGSGECSQPVLSDGLTFTLRVEGAVMCEYSYQVESLAAPGQIPSRDGANLLVVTSEEGAQLPPILLALSIGDDDEVVNIEEALDENYPEGYSLHEDTTVLGSGIAVADGETGNITYTIGNEGYTRVVYILESPEGGSVKLGTLDIAVSDTLNHPPVADNFVVDEGVEVDVAVIIDVSEHVGPDDQVVQLVGVESITATVTSADPDNTSNTQFSFIAPTPGLHYVSYLVHDHYGGYATAIVEVHVIPAEHEPLWGDIEVQGLTFSAPMTVRDALEGEVVFQNARIDKGYSPYVLMAAFSDVGGENYCNSFARIPTESEMNKLIETDPSIVHKWPAGEHYLVLSNDEINTMSMDGRVTPYVSPAYLTCVSGTTLVTLDIEVVDGSTVVADGVQRTRISIWAKSSDGLALPGVVINIDQEGEADAPSSVTTDDNGQGMFELRSTVANDVKITASLAEGESDPESVSVVVKFIGDKSTAELVRLSIIEDEGSADGVMANTLEVEVIDALDNPVSGVDVTMSYSSGEGARILTTGDAGKANGDVTLYSSEEFRGGVVDITASLGSDVEEATTTFLCRFIGDRGERCAGDGAVFLENRTYLPPLSVKEAELLEIEYQDTLDGLVEVAWDVYSDKYCKALRDVNYLGHDSWGRPYSSEWVPIWRAYTNEHERHLFNDKQWIDQRYWTHTDHGSGKVTHTLSDITGHYRPRDTPLLLSCFVK